MQMRRMVDELHGVVEQLSHLCILPHKYGRVFGLTILLFVIDFDSCKGWMP